MSLLADTQTPVPRSLTRPVSVGNIQIGGNAPVSIQSMTNTDTADTASTLKQIHELAQAGAQIVRVAIPHKNVLDSFENLCSQSPLPLIADVHFDYRLAIAAAEKGASALRINPGNIGGFCKVDSVIGAAKTAGIPIRIGVNEGSLAKEIEANQTLSSVEKLVNSAQIFVEHFKERGFFDIVISAKTHDVTRTIEVNRAIASKLPDIPLHLGVTEAGSLLPGTIKNVAALSTLLLEGIGNTLRISLTEKPSEEVKVAKLLMQSIGLKRSGPEIISCPTCGRTKINLQSYVGLVEEALKDCKKDITVAVMGCVVNGPGEAKHADIGVAGGDGCAILFKGGKKIKRIKEEEIVPELIGAIEAFPQTTSTKRTVKIH